MIWNAGFQVIFVPDEFKAGQRYSPSASKGNLKIMGKLFALTHYKW